MLIENLKKELTNINYNYTVIHEFDDKIVIIEQIKNKLISKQLIS